MYLEEESREPPYCLRMLRQSRRIPRMGFRLDLPHGVRQAVVCISRDRCTRQKDVPPARGHHAAFQHDVVCAERE